MKINLQLFVDIIRMDAIDQNNFDLAADHILSLAEIPFHKTATITSAACATAVNILSNSLVPTGKKVYLQGYIAKVDGATDWATTTSVKIQDTNSTPIDFVTLAALTLDANEIHIPTSDSATLEAAYYAGTGGTAGKGLQLKGNANGTGSDLIVTVWGVIK